MGSRQPSSCPNGRRLAATVASEGVPIPAPNQGKSSTVLHVSMSATVVITQYAAIKGSRVSEVYGDHVGFATQLTAHCQLRRSA